MAKPSGSESSIPTNRSLTLPDSGKALFPRHRGHKWRNIIEMIICIKTQIWADISPALCNPRGCLGEGGEGVLPVSLGGMINEARILGGPSPPPLRPRDLALHMKLACACSPPSAERRLMILPTPSPNSAPKPWLDPGAPCSQRRAGVGGWVGGGRGSGGGGRGRRATKLLCAPLGSVRDALQVCTRCETGNFFFPCHL